MSQNSRGRAQKKPAMTIKERRAEKRVRSAEAQEVLPKRKRDRAQPGN